MNFKLFDTFNLNDNIKFPDWNLIDEISIVLLEQGIGTFETLQQALPSVVFATIDKIFDNSTNQDDKNYCTEKRFIKLFKIAQFQLNYVLHTQQELLTDLLLQTNKYEKLKAENKLYRRSLKKKNETTMELQNFYKCNECSKIFMNNLFLVEHIRRRHLNKNNQNCNCTCYKNNNENIFEDKEHSSSLKNETNEHYKDDLTKNYHNYDQTKNVLYDNNKNLPINQNLSPTYATLS